MTWHEERRRNLAAEAEERRTDKKADYELRRQQRRDDAEFAREQKRRDRDEKRKARDTRRKERKARRAERARTWTPERLYGRSTYTIVVASALASLPAQFMHFGHISPILLTIPIALEGAAWCTFAGVAYADSRQLHPGIRWALRALSMVFASFAAWINWMYGRSLAPSVGEAEATVVAAALAAVTMLGPLLFEVRQWVRTLSATNRNAKQRAEVKFLARHERKRRRKFRKVAQRQQKIMLAAPYGTVSTEDAWRQAWADIEGAPPGITADVVAVRLAAEQAVADAVAEAERSPEQVAVDLLLAELFPASRGDDGPAGGSPKRGPQGGQPGGGGRGVRTRERDASEGATALGGIGKRASGRAARKDAEEPLAPEHIDAAQKLYDANPATFSTPAVARTIGRSATYAKRVRDHVLNRAESADR